MASSRPEVDREASTVALAPAMTAANASPYMHRLKTCRQRSIGWRVLEAKLSFRRPKCWEALGWLCLPIPPATLPGLFWERGPAEDTASPAKWRPCRQCAADFQCTTLGGPHHQRPCSPLPSVGRG